MDIPDDAYGAPYHGLRMEVTAWAQVLPDEVWIDICKQRPRTWREWKQRDYEAALDACKRWGEKWLPFREALGLETGVKP